MCRQYIALVLVTVLLVSPGLVAVRSVVAADSSPPKTLDFHLPPATQEFPAKPDQMIFPGAPSPFQGWGFGIHAWGVNERLVRSKSKGTYWEPQGDVWVQALLDIETLAGPMYQPFPFDQLALEDSSGTLYPVDTKMMERDRSNIKKKLSPDFASWMGGQTYSIWVYFDANVPVQDKQRGETQYLLRTLDGQMAIRFSWKISPTDETDDERNKHASLPGGACASRAFFRPVPSGEREAVVVVESKVKVYESEQAAQRAMESEIAAFLAPGGVDHSGDSKAVQLDALVGTLGLFNSRPVFLIGWGSTREGPVVYSVTAAKTAISGLPFNVSDDVYPLLEMAKSKQGDSVDKLVLARQDLGPEWEDEDPQLLTC